MTGLRKDVEYAFRLLAKTPAFAVTAILVLAVGIGANTAIFSLVNELLFRPLSGRASELVSVYSQDRTRPDSFRLFSYPNYADIRDRSGVFDAVLAQTFAVVAVDDGKPRALAAVVSSNYFDTLRVGLAAGRSFTADEERPGARIPVAIVTYARWVRDGRDPATIGRTISINADSYTIVGVAPEGFTGTQALISPDVFLPLGMFEAVVSDRFRNNGRGLADRSNAGLSVMGILKPGQPDALVASRLDALSHSLEAAYPGENHDQALSVGAASRISAGPEPPRGSALTAVMALLMALAGVVLVIACLNMANMLLARGRSRRKELAVRLALGASRSRVIRQLLTESVVIATGGAILGVLASQWAMRAIASMLSASLPFAFMLRTTLDATVLVATVAFTAVGVLAFGLGPALQLSRRNLIVDLKDRSPEGALSRRVFSARNAMVMGQIALSLAMLTAGGIFARTTLDAAAASPGYPREHLIVASLDTTLAGLDAAQGRQAYVEILRRIRSMPGIASASLASTVPFGDVQESRPLEQVAVNGRPPTRAKAYRIIGADYFQTLGLRMIRGREFTAGEEASAAMAGVAIVDAAFAAQMFGDANPIGQMIRESRTDDGTGTESALMEIVGVAPPLREELLDKKPAAHVYVPFAPSARAGMLVHARLAAGVDESAAMAGMREAIRVVNSRLPVLAISTMQTVQDGSLELFAVRTAAGVFAGLAALALLLASIGVYGVRAYLVAERTREIGIRMALGATARDVMRLVIGDGLMLAAAGVAAGLPLAIVLSVGLRSVFVDVGGVDYGVVAMATLILGAVTVGASAVPARRAARVEPLAALRTD